MSSVSLRNQLWLIQTLNRLRVATKEEIDRQWVRSSNCENGESGIPERTFFRWKDAILETWGIEIKCDRSSREYYIDRQSVGPDNRVKRWLIDTFTVDTLISDSHELKQRILFDEIPSGQEWLNPIICAMRDNRVMRVTYHQFDSEPEELMLEPFCLKVFRKRWNLVARLHDDHSQIHRYSLDRITSVREVGEEFRYPSNFSPADYFKDIYGVDKEYRVFDRKRKIRIRVDRLQYPWIERLPIHHSQRVVKETEDYVDIELKLIPNYEFIQELLMQSMHIEVLSPMELRETMAEIAYDTLCRYGGHEL